MRSVLLEDGCRGSASEERGHPASRSMTASPARSSTNRSAPSDTMGEYQRVDHQSRTSTTPFHISTGVPPTPDCVPLQRGNRGTNPIPNDIRRLKSERCSGRRGGGQQLHTALPTGLN